MDIGKEVRRAHQVSTPIVPVSSPDPLSTMDRIARAIVEFRKASGKTQIPPATPIAVWDRVRGVTPLEAAFGDLVVLNPAWAQSVKKYYPKGEDFVNPTAAVLQATRLPPHSILFMLNLHRDIGIEHNQPNEVVQALQLVRDTLKAHGQSIVLLSPGFPSLPPELGELSVIDEPLPTMDEIAEIITARFGDLQAGLKKAGKPVPKLTDDDRQRSTNACRGLSGLAIDQVVSMSLAPTGIEVDRLWKRKIEWIKATSGMEVHLGGERLDDLGGLTQLKKVLCRFKGVTKRPIGVVVLLDEFEKQMMAIGGGDNTGVLDRMNSKLLDFMERHNARGIILMGGAGVGKSHVARAIGNELGVLTVIVQIGDAMNKYVGESEQRMSSLLKVIAALGDYPLFIGACNTEGRITPELERRFRRGKFYLDLPDADEKAVIWTKQMKAYGLAEQQLPDDIRWTGADIRNCCEKADDESISLVEAAEEGDVPVGIRQADVIDALRQAAAGKWRSASKPGMYEGPQDKPTNQADFGRLMSVDFGEIGRA